MAYLQINESLTAQCSDAPAVDQVTADWLKWFNNETYETLPLLVGEHTTKSRLGVPTSSYTYTLLCKYHRQNGNFLQCTPVTTLPAHYLIIYRQLQAPANVRCRTPFTLQGVSVMAMKSFCLLEGKLALQYIGRGILLILREGKLALQYIGRGIRRGD
uniref:Uncharacterized protein n=1 Tax=Talaromyces marneffei PM1 TaxID=1077442 RepID=A0A093XBF9_TALMA